MPNSNRLLVLGDVHGAARSLDQVLDRAREENGGGGEVWMMQNFLPEPTAAP